MMAKTRALRTVQWVAIWRIGQIASELSAHSDDPDVVEAANEIAIMLSVLEDS